MRNLVTVLIKIKNLIPENSHENKAFKLAILQLLTKLTYVAPELYTPFWGEGSKILERYLPHPEQLSKSPEWMQNIQKTWMDE